MSSFGTLLVIAHQLGAHTATYIFYVSTKNMSVVLTSFSHITYHLFLVGLSQKRKNQAGKNSPFCDFPATAGELSYG